MAHTYGAVQCTKMCFDLISSSGNLTNFIVFRLKDLGNLDTVILHTLFYLFQVLTKSDKKNNKIGGTYIKCIRFNETDVKWEGWCKLC